MSGQCHDQAHSRFARRIAGAAISLVMFFATAALADDSHAAAAAPTTLLITTPYTDAERLRRLKQVDPAELRFRLLTAGPGTGYRLERSDQVSAAL